MQALLLVLMQAQRKNCTAILRSDSTLLYFDGNNDMLRCAGLRATVNDGKMFMR
jgi:hypothetical protein